MKTFLKNKIRYFAVRSAEWLNKNAACFSVKQQKIGLIIFCLLFTVISISILIETFSKENFNNKIYMMRFHPPAHIGKNIETPDPVITKEAYERIEQFKSKLDSNMIHARPHLLDSIQMFEQLYRSQSKK